MEWLALLIPIVTAVFLIIFFRTKVIWWEAIIPIVIVIPIILISKWTSYLAQTHDTEYWGGYVVRVEYYEDWNELVTYTVVVNDGQGHSHTEVRTRVDYHPAVYVCYNSNKESTGLSSSGYRNLVNSIGGKERFEDLHRAYFSDDGDMYYCDWDGRDATLVPTTTQHSYTNRIQGSRSIHNYEEVDPEEYGLVEYPDMEWFDVPSILGDKVNPDANTRLNFWNARLGAIKEVRIWVILFENKSYEAGLAQESYWVGSNKNEFVVCIGKHGDQIDWCHVFSWTKEEQLKVDVKDWVMNRKKLNQVEFVDYLAVEVNKKFVRRDFEEFDYIDIEMGGVAAFIMYLLTILATTGVGIWAVLNDLEEDESFIDRIKYRFKS